MIILYIILGILLLVFLFLLIRIQVFATYSETLTLTLKVLFFKLQLLPPVEKKEKKPKKEKPKPKKPKKEKPKEEKEEKKKKPSFLTKLKQKRGLSGLLSLFTAAAKIALGMLRQIISHIVIKKLDVGIRLSGEDAAQVALNYGKVCSSLYPAVNVIVSATVCKHYNVAVEPVFDPDRKTEVYADVHLYLRPIFVVGAAIKAGIKLLIVRIKF